jgi:hypothetical protein
VVTLGVYSQVDLPRLVDGATLRVFGVLTVQILAVLMYERRHRSPLLLVLVFVLVFFYLPRVLTLYWAPEWPSSTTLERLRPVHVDDINRTLWFVVAANAAMFLGIVVGQRLRFMPPRKRTTAEGPARTINGRRAFWWLAFTIAYGVYTTLFVPLGVGVELRALRYLGLLLNPILAIVVGIVYVHQTRVTEPGHKGSHVRGIVGLIVLLVLTQTSFGSRSAILTIVQTLLFLLLALGVYRVSRRVVVGSAILLALSVPLFTVATAARMVRAAGDTGVGGMAQAVTETVVGQFVNGRVLLVVRPIMERTAFLDSSVDLVKNAGDYDSVINLPFYARSVVDSLTPGFDVFDTPRASNALSLIYQYQSRDVRRDALAYQSDQFNVYGEYYVLFGVVLGLVAIGLTAWVFQCWLSRIRIADSYSSIVWRYFVVLAFFNWVISFGLDWQIIVGAREAAILAVTLPVLRRS